MAELTRKSRMAIVEETTENTPVLPTDAKEYVPLRDDFSMSLNFEELENNELKASIGQSKSQQGDETPTASVGLFLRGSGTEGTAPNLGLANLLEAAYGSKDVEVTEYNTVAGSTTTAINVDTGEGAFFSIGQALLVKHASNDWEIAIVKSISGDVLTPLFALQNAPATGTDLGLAVSFRASDSGHIPLSVWDYRGNQAGVGLMSGARVNSLSVDATANQQLAATFEMEGLGNYFNPLVVDSTNFSLDFDDGGGEENASITQKTYRDPNELAAEIQTKMDALTADNITVTYNNDGANAGKFTIASDGGTLSLLWNTGTNTATTIGGLIGFSTAADDTGATTYTSDSTIDLTSPQTPDFSDLTDPHVVKNQRVMLGDQADNTCYSVQNFTYELGTPVTRAPSICAESGTSESIINSREVTASFVANIPRFDADKFTKQRSNSSLSFQYNFGDKSAGNWVAGKSGAIHIKEAIVTAHEMGDNDGLVTLQVDIKGHVDDSGNSETALNFL